MRRESDAPRSRGKNPFVPAHRRHGFRHQPALLAEARRLPHPGSADGMDGQSGFESHARPDVADNAAFGDTNSTDLLAVALQVVAATPQANGSVGLQKAPRAPAAAKPGLSPKPKV